MSPISRSASASLQSVPDAPTLARQLRECFASGRTRPVAWRLQQLEAMRVMLRECAEEFVSALQDDLGRPAFEAWGADVATSLEEVDAARRNLRRWMRAERAPSPLIAHPARSRIVREPLGVVLIIAPWNYPLELVLSPAVGALAAGNCVVLKPSELAPHTAAALARQVPRYLDPECVTVVEGGAEATSSLLAERFDHIFYTGSGRVGRIVLEAAARHLTPVTLELGGKSPCIVARDADLDVAARRIAWGKFLNAGQTCTAPDYVLVEKQVEEALLERLEAVIKRFFGRDPHRCHDYGRIVNARHHERLRLLLEGQTIVVGGDWDADDRYLAPTVLRDVPHDSRVMQEEIFGPILPVLQVPDLEAAIAFANRREKPLALYVFARSPRVWREVIARTSSGGVSVNATLWHSATPKLPFGGVGASGMGAYHGRASFETFSHRKSIFQQSTAIDLGAVYPPYGRFKTAIARKLL